MFTALKHLPKPSLFPLSFLKSHSFADRKYQRFAQQEQKETPQSFSLEDFISAAQLNDFKVKSFIEPIRFFNEIVQNNKKLKLQPQAISEKIAPFLTKLEANVENFALPSDMQQIHTFCSLLQLRSQVFWQKFYSHALSQQTALSDSFFRTITSEISLFPGEFREKFRESLPKLIETRYFPATSSKKTLKKAQEAVPWLYKWLIFSKGYDFPLVEPRISWQNTAENLKFLNNSSTFFPLLRRNFRTLPTNQKINALVLYFSVFRGEIEEKNINNLLRIASPSLAKAVPRLSSLQLVQLCELYRKTGVFYEKFWQSLEKTVLSRVDTDYSLNYLIKFLQGFAQFRCGSRELFMEVDRYAGFHAEEIEKPEVLQLLRVFSISSNFRYKFFCFLEEKLWEFRESLTVSEVIEVLQISAKSGYLSKKMQHFFEANIMQSVNTLKLEEIASLLESLAVLQGPSPLFEALKPRVQEILEAKPQESAIFAVLVNYFEENDKVSWRQALGERIKELICEKKLGFLVKFGEFIVKVSRKCVDEEVLRLFEEKCREIVGELKGNQKKDLQFILWKLGNAGN